LKKQRSLLPRTKNCSRRKSSKPMLFGRRLKLIVNKHTLRRRLLCSVALKNSNAVTVAELVRLRVVVTWLVKLQLRALRLVRLR